jgi:hypothetical protein
MVSVGKLSAQVPPVGLTIAKRRRSGRLARLGSRQAETYCHSLDAPSD